MPASSIPGYLQGYRFSDGASYYDSPNFLDQGPYSGLGNTDLEITVGTPAFVTVNGQRGLTLDNTLLGWFLPPIPWSGSCITVMKPNMTVNGNIYPVLVGQSGTLTNNGSIRLRRATAADYRHSLISGGAFTNAEAAHADDGVKVCAFALSQETRKGYSTRDGVTVTETSALADGGNGNGLAWGSLGNAGVTADVRGIRARFGNLSGTIDSASATTNTATMFEMHYFKGNPLVDSLASLKVFMDELKASYGVS